MTSVQGQIIITNMSTKFMIKLLIFYCHTNQGRWSMGQCGLTFLSIPGTLDKLPESVLFLD